MKKEEDIQLGALTSLGLRPTRSHAAQRRPCEYLEAK